MKKFIAVLFLLVFLTARIEVGNALTYYRTFTPDARPTESVDFFWVWENGDTLYRRNQTLFSINVINTLSKCINVTKILVHYPWMEKGIYYVRTIDEEVCSGWTLRIVFDIAVDANTETGKTDGFMFAVDYTNENDTFTSSIVGAPPVTIREGIGLYIDQEIQATDIAFLILFFLLVVGALYRLKKTLEKLLTENSRHIPSFIFVFSFIVFLLSVRSNFVEWAVPDINIQGFAITGDEYHYLRVIRLLMGGSLDTRTVYFEGEVNYGRESIAWFTSGQLVPLHYIGLPVLCIVPYIIGAWLTGSGLYGALLANCLIGSGIIVLIYKISMRLINNISTSLIVSLTFAFFTLLFPWVGHLFPEVAIGFALLFASYKVLTASTKWDWVIIGVVLGLLPFLRFHTIILGFTSILLVFAYSLKNKQWGVAKHSLLGYGIGIGVFLFFVAGFLNMMPPPPLNYVTSPPNTRFLGFSISEVFYLGLIGHWIDSNSGLIFYSPIVILSFLGVRPFLRSKHTLFTLFVASNFVIWYVCSGVSGTWNGWLSIPSRYMICILPLLSIPMAYAVEELKNHKTFEIAYTGLCLLSFIPNSLIAMNRVLGYTFVWSQGVPRSRYILCLRDTFGIDINVLPDFAFAWLQGGEIGNVPQNPWLLLFWACVFLVPATMFLHRKPIFKPVLARLRAKAEKAIKITIKR